MKRSVILKHTLPDGSWHHDWLIQRSDQLEERVPTFRTAHDRPDTCDAFEAQRLDDHRAFYLDHEGEVSGGRGSVVRLATGTVSHAIWNDGHIGLEIDFKGTTRLFVGEHIEGGRWRFSAR